MNMAAKYKVLQHKNFLQKILVKVVQNSAKVFSFATA